MVKGLSMERAAHRVASVMSVRPAIAGGVGLVRFLAGDAKCGDGRDRLPVQIASNRERRFSFTGKMNSPPPSWMRRAVAFTGPRRIPWHATPFMARSQRPATNRDLTHQMILERP
jgi:hypothetical protein